MNRTQLLQNFDSLAETPGAVAKIHELVIQLAIRGRLFPQDPLDSSAQAAADDTRRHAKADLPTIGSDDAPFDLPTGWAWLRIGEAMRLINGRAFKPTDWSTTGLPIVRIQNLNNPNAPFNYCDFEVDQKALVRNDDFLISWSGTPGTSFGAFIWNRGPAVLNQHIFRAELIGDAYDKRFLRIAINGRLEEMIAKAHGAVGLQHITKGKLELLVLPLPPLAEQNRIVAKVEELLALCDELEAQQAVAREHRTRLVRSALDHLTTATDEAGFRKHAAFILHPSSPILEAAAVPALRQVILSLAVQGRLVPQNPKDGPGADVVSEFSIRELPDPDHILDLTLPAHWAVTAFANLARIRSGVTKGRNLAGRQTKAFPYLRVANVQRGFLELDVVKDIQIPIEELGRFRLGHNDLLITEGGDWDKVGRTAVWHGEIADCIHQNHVFRARLVSNKLQPEWFMLYLNSPVGRRYFESAAKQTTNLASINATELRGCPVPVPPLPEQRRIVAKVDELMRWCDALEAGLVTAQTAATRLLDASLHRLLTAQD